MGANFSKIKRECLDWSRVDGRCYTEANETNTRERVETAEGTRVLRVYRKCEESNCPLMRK